MMSIERLWSRQVPKSIDSQHQPGVNSMTMGDILNILSQVQRYQPVGSAVLDATIAGDVSARQKLVEAIMAVLKIQKLTTEMSYALANAAVTEVCDSNICEQCKGTKQVLNKKLSKWVECRTCCGLGKRVLNHQQLYRSINKHLPTSQKVTGDVFVKQYYDIYMDAVNALYDSASAAAQCAKQILDKLDEAA